MPSIVRRLFRRPAAVAAVLLLAVTTLTAGAVLNAAPADAATCYGGATSVEKEVYKVRMPTSGTYKTGSACSDINLKLTYQGHVGLYVRVCFASAGCQSSYKYVGRHAGWKVIATDVKDGTKYYFQFYESDDSKYASFDLAD